MKLATKAVIFSGIVFPGAGYFIVGKKLKGSVSLALVIGGLAFIMADVFYRANIIAEKIIYGQVPNDVLAIRQEILLTPGNLSPQLMSGLSIAIGLIWLLGIIDSYLIGRQLDAKTTSEG